MELWHLHTKRTLKLHMYLLWVVQLCWPFPDRARGVQMRSSTCPSREDRPKPQMSGQHKLQRSHQRWHNTRHGWCTCHKEERDPLLKARYTSEIYRFPSSAYFSTFICKVFFLDKLILCIVRKVAFYALWIKVSQLYWEWINKGYSDLASWRGAITCFENYRWKKVSKLNK